MFSEQYMKLPNFIRKKSTIKLPEPQLDNEFPLMKALQLRRSKREWKPEPLSSQQISNILWSAFGVSNFSQTSTEIKRTAPSGCNIQDIKIYVALKNGVFLYEPMQHELKKILSKDIRVKVTTQKNIHTAPMVLIYTSDFDTFPEDPYETDHIKWVHSATHTGFIGQNTYLYCAAANLNTTFIGHTNRKELQEILKLNSNQKVVFTQAVGISLDI